MKNLSFTFTLFVSLFIIISSCNGKKVHTKMRITITVKVIHIADCDNDLFTADKKTIRIRMDGIDTPERSMAFFKVSKNNLGELCMNKTIRIVKPILIGMVG